MLSLLLVCVTLCGAVEDMRDLYTRTKLMYGGVSSGLSPSDEKEHYKSFVSFVKMVEEINHDASLPFNAEINAMALETEAERHAHLGLNISKMSMGDRQHIAVNKRSLDILEAAAKEVDYSSKLPVIKNQGSCGSCWTFGAIAALEYQINRDREGSPRALSEQQCLDCAYPSSRDGCSGGWPTACYDYANQIKSKVASMKDYPYRAKDGNCVTKKESSISGFTVDKGGKYITEGDAAMLVAVGDKSIGVLSVAIAVINSMYGYKDGVYQLKSSESCNSVNHAVDVVGYGVFKGAAFWRVRNSWGAGWGDKGYVNMLRGTGGRNVNLCQISRYAHYPEVSGKDDGTNDDEEQEEEDNEEEGGDEDLGSWCEHQNRYLKGYSGGSKVVIVDLKTAKSACGSRSDCGGITIEKNGDITLRKTTVPKFGFGFTSYVPGCEDQEPVCTFEEITSFYFSKGNNILTKLNKPLSEVKEECLENEACGGITCSNKSSNCGMRKETTGRKGKAFTSYKKVCK